MTLTELIKMSGKKSTPRVQLNENKEMKIANLGFIESVHER